MAFLLQADDGPLLGVYWVVLGILVCVPARSKLELHPLCKFSWLKVQKIQTKKNVFTAELSGSMHGS